ncbi:hypothetical protein NB725_003908 [Pantoea ananatis]|nr:hypothetical protein [Pantoea ananatis]MCW0338982.1 hypothetical protein [Pantoea ananatis]MCW0359673.1 hypothetical protein [Pantoea ananatis]MCW0364298.1 hypothetical protein [Pantoea ananatis]
MRLKARAPLMFKGATAPSGRAVNNCTAGRARGPLGDNGNNCTGTCRDKRFPSWQRLPGIHKTQSISELAGNYQVSFCVSALTFLLYIIWIVE